MADVPGGWVVAVKPPYGVNIRSGVWGSLLGTSAGQQYRVIGSEVAANGELWLKIWWSEGVTGYIAGWLCPLAMLSFAP